MDTQIVLDELKERVEQLIINAQDLSVLGQNTLQFRQSEGSWNALECLEHLNRYSDFYISSLTKSIETAKHSSVTSYKPTWFGNKCAMDMLPQDGELKSTMKTFKSKNPSLDGIGSKVIEKFITQQKTVLKIIESARAVSLERTKSKTTLPLIQFKLGDALRFYIYHEVRHMLQAQKAALIVNDNLSMVN